MDHAVRRPPPYRIEGGVVGQWFLGTNSVPAAGTIGLDARLAATERC